MGTRFGEGLPRLRSNSPKAALLVTFPPPPHVPVADANDLRCLKPRNLLRHCLQYHFLYFHRPLHRGPQVRFHASHGLLLSPPAKRTYRVLSQPDISCANDISIAEQRELVGARDLSQLCGLAQHMLQQRIVIEHIHRSGMSLQRSFQVREYLAHTRFRERIEKENYERIIGTREGRR